MTGIQEIRRAVSDSWQAALIAVLSLTGLVSLLLWRLTSLIPIVTPPERQLYAASTSLQSLMDNPLHPIQKAALFCLRYFNIDTLFTARLISVSLAVISVGLLAYVFSQWFRSGAVVIGLIVFILSSWFLTTARFITPDMSYIALVSAGLAYGAWTRTTRHSGVVMATGIILALLYFYTPGLIWLALFAIFWQGRTTVRHITDAPKTTVIALTAVVMCLAPLSYAIYKNPQLGLDVLGLTHHPMDALQSSADRALHAAQALVFNGPESAQDGLVGIGHYDIFSIACFILGISTIIGWRKLDRSGALLGSFVVLALLVCLQGIVPATALMPLIAISICAGINLLYTRWFSVFPKNPVTRTVSITLFSAILALTSFYHIQKYFIAWPQAPETVELVRMNSSTLRDSGTIE